MGYECLASGKIISFCLGSLKRNWCKKNNFLPINKFGHPLKLEDEGFCWSNRCSEKKVNNLLENIISMKQTKFNKKIKIIKKNYVY